MSEPLLRAPEPDIDWEYKSPYLNSIRNSKTLEEALQNFEKFNKEYVYTLEQDLEMAQRYERLFDRDLKRRVYPPLEEGFKTLSKDNTKIYNRLLKTLINEKFISKDSHGNLLPLEPHISSGLFEKIEIPNKHGEPFSWWALTPKGKITLRLLFLRK